MYGKKKLNFGEVATKIISEERRMKGDECTSSSPMLLTRSRPNGKKIYETYLSCWKCGMLGHLKRSCPGEAISEKTLRQVLATSALF
jgi:hypothetical protein